MTKYINADEMSANESEAYMKAQLQVDSLTKKINEVVHIKIQQLIADTEPEDVQPVVHAKIINRKDIYNKQCSNCKNFLGGGMLVDLPYCPYCGAKMDGDEHE